MKTQMCDWEGCDQPAVEVIRFNSTSGHVHDCATHVALLREWADVVWSSPMPCPIDHGDIPTWTDDPPELT